jgi:hypothetical protein
MPPPKTARLPKWQLWLICLSLGLLWLSGVIWLLLHYYGQVQGEFGPEANPGEAWMLRLHGFVLIPALLGMGSLMVVHAPKGWMYPGQRVAGVVLTASMVILTGSGYLLYYLGDEEWRSAIALAHWTIGLTSLVLFLWHFLNGRRQRLRR